MILIAFQPFGNTSYLDLPPTFGLVTYGSEALEGALGARKSRGIAGMGLASPGCSGMVISGVTMTINSVLLRSTSLVLKRLPRIGRLDKPGMREMVSVNRLSIKPPITKLCPSPSSMLVSILREDNAGIVNPLNDRAFE